MGVLQIIEAALTTNGFEGLVVPGQCGCIIGDLSPGNCLSDNCEAGFKHIHSVTGEWIVSTSRDGITDDDIKRCIADCS